MGKRGPKEGSGQFTSVFRFRADQQLIDAIEAAADKNGEKSSVYARRVLEEATTGQPITTPKPEPAPEQNTPSEQPATSAAPEQWDPEELAELVKWALAVFERRQEAIETEKANGNQFATDLYHDYDLVDLTGLAMADLYSKIRNMSPLKQAAAVNALMTEIERIKAEREPFYITGLKFSGRQAKPGRYAFAANVISEQCGFSARNPAWINFRAGSKSKKVPGKPEQARTITYNQSLINILKQHDAAAFAAAGGVAAVERALIRAIDEWFKKQGL